MLARLTGVRATELVKALEKSGFEVIRQKGSHMTLNNFGSDKTTLVAMHPGDFPRSLLKKIIKDAGLTEEQFRHFL
jgi:predicted RNA binding protein YcfA (HicA-like mRNA interferase family)